jgi:hypothetical protein
MLVVATTLLLLYLGAEVLGWRRHTSFLSLTPSDPSSGTGHNVLLGASYIVLHLLATIAVPIFVIASGIALLLTRLTTPRPGRGDR